VEKLSDGKLAYRVDEAAQALGYLSRRSGAGSAKGSCELSVSVVGCWSAARSWKSFCGTWRRGGWG